MASYSITLYRSSFLGARMNVLRDTSDPEGIYGLE